MALQFCSNSLLLKSTVQLFRVITEIKIGREKNKRYHLTYKVEKQKGMRSHTKCTLSSYNFSPRAFCLFTVLRDKQIQSSLPQNTNTHIQEINNQETPTCIQVNTQTPTNNHTHSKRVKNKKQISACGTWRITLIVFQIIPIFAAFPLLNSYSFPHKPRLSFEVGQTHKVTEH